MPSCEMVAIEWCGRDDGLTLIVIGAATTYRTHGGIIVYYRDGGIVGEEYGSKGGILRGKKQSRVGGVAIVPILEMVTSIGRGGEDNRIVVTIEAGTRDGACRGVVAQDRDIRIVGDKDSHERGVGG